LPQVEQNIVLLPYAGLSLPFCGRIGSVQGSDRHCILTPRRFRIKAAASPRPLCRVNGSLPRLDTAPEPVLKCSSFLQCNIKTGSRSPKRFRR